MSLLSVAPRHKCSIASTGPADGCPVAKGKPCGSISIGPASQDFTAKRSLCGSGLVVISIGPVSQGPFTKRRPCSISTVGFIRTVGFISIGATSKEAVPI